MFFIIRPYSFLILFVLFILILLIYFSLSFSYIFHWNLLRLLFSFELLILLFSSSFLFIGILYGDMYSQVIVLGLLTIAAVEASIGLALLYIHYRLWFNIKLEFLNKLKG
jgi:NADH-quinone oxidoreductase subunit K